MSIRYRKRLHVFPGVHLNISHSSKGWSRSWSVKVLGVNWNSRTKRKSVDLPGGLSWHESARPAVKKAQANRRASHGAPTATEAPGPYRPAKWPYVVSAVLMVLGVLGGAVWQSLLLFTLIAVAAFLVQRRRGGAAMPVHRDAVTPAPIDYEAEARRADELGLPETAAAWRASARKDNA